MIDTMHIVIATPLYPPDVAPSASYAKEVATRLSKRHKVTVLTYGRLPEEISGVDIIAINKKQPLLFRLLEFTKQIQKHIKKADLLYVQNGPSVELPVLFATAISNKKTLFHISDKAAHIQAQRNAFSSFLFSLLSKRAVSVLNNSPEPKPEILPFEPASKESVAMYEKSWDDHLKELEKVFNYV